MTISVPSVMPQIVGFRGSAKFYHTSFFVDDKSDFTFAHHQTSTSVDKMIKAKYAHETELRQRGKEVRDYHADNGTYDVAHFREEVNDNKQTLTFCGVVSHHQNGRAKNLIKIMCNPATNMLIHAMYRWQKVFKQSLWTHPIYLTSEIRNKHKINKQGTAHIEKLTGLS